MTFQDYWDKRITNVGLYGECKLAFEAGQRSIKGGVGSIKEEFNRLRKIATDKGLSVTVEYDKFDMAKLVYTNSGKERIIIGKTTVYLLDPSGKVVYIGRSRCSESDQWDKKKGRLIALSRAVKELKLGAPKLGQQ